MDAEHIEDVEALGDRVDRMEYVLERLAAALIADRTVGVGRTRQRISEAYNELLGHSRRATPPSGPPPPCNLPPPPRPVERLVFLTDAGREVPVRLLGEPGPQPAITLSGPYAQEFLDDVAFMAKVADVGVGRVGVGRVALR